MNMFKKVFKSPRNSPANYHIAPFKELYKIILNLKFRKYLVKRNKHQQKLNKILKVFKEMKRIIVPANITGSLYIIDIALYKNRNTKYKHSPSNKLDKIKRDWKQQKNQELMIALNHIPHQKSRINLKDQKNNLENHPKMRLKSPSKSDVRHISKNILEKTIPVLKTKIGFSLWFCTQEFIGWFIRTAKNKKIEMYKTGQRQLLLNY